MGRQRHQPFRWQLLGRRGAFHVGGYGNKSHHAKTWKLHRFWHLPHSEVLVVIEMLNAFNALSEDACQTIPVIWCDLCIVHSWRWSILEIGGVKCRISFGWTARCFFFFFVWGAAACSIFPCFRINMKHGVPVHIHARVFVPLFHQRLWSAYFLECGGSHRAWNFFRYLCSLWGVCLLQAKTSSHFQSCFGMTPQPAVSACVPGFGTWVANNRKYDNDCRLPTAIDVCGCLSAEDGSLVQMPPWANPYLIVAATMSIGTWVWTTWGWVHRARPALFAGSGLTS